MTNRPNILLIVTDHQVFHGHHRPGKFEYVWPTYECFSEEVARIPLAIRWPAEISAGFETDHLVSNMDVVATMLDAADIAVPETMDSRSLLPLCRDPRATTWPHHLVCEHHGHCEDLVLRIIIEGRFKYVAAVDEGDELYDLVDDPYEMGNLIDDPAYAEIIAGLQERLLAHIRETGDRRAEPLAAALVASRG